MKLTRIAPPTEYPVSLAEARAQCRVTHTEQDPLILGLVAAATDYLDGYSGVFGRALVTQTWQMVSRSFPTEMPFGPVQSISSIQYRDTDDVLQTLDAAEYRLVGSILEPVNSWPPVSVRQDAVTVNFVAGYGDASSVPEDVRSAILVLVCLLYDNPGFKPEDIPPAFYLLAGSKRVHLI